MKLITSKNLTFSYDGKIVADNLNFTINKGDYLCIIGENGAGKSTLIKGLLRLKKQTTGQIIFQNGLKSNEIGYLPQRTDYHRNFPASVKEVVFSGYLNKMGIKCFFGRNEKNIIYDNMKKIGVFDIRRKCFSDLSGGQQQRVLLARALCATTKVILLDEPTIGLDIINKEKIRKFILEINHEYKTSIFLTSHDMVDVEKLASKIIAIDNGSKIFDGTINELRDKYGVMNSIKIEFDQSIDNKIIFEKLNGLDLFFQNNILKINYNNSLHNPANILSHILDLNYGIKNIAISEPEIDEIIKLLYSSKIGGEV